MKVTPPTDEFDDHFVGRFNQLVVTSPELMDFVMKAVAKSDAA